MVISLVLGISTLAVFYEYIIELNPFLASFYRENGLITMIFSTRDLALKETGSYVFMNWDVINYCLGTISYIGYRVELELFDLIFFFGMLGSLVYLCLFYKAFFKNNSNLLNEMLIVILICSFVSGALLISIPSMIFLYLILVKKSF